MAKKVAVMLSGCGVFDGTEIYEAAYTMLALSKAGAETFFVAPDVDQLHVFDHRKGGPAEGEKRNVLTEAARIARGDVKSAADVKAGDYDALIFPGGFGAAKNLCTFGVDGPDCKVNPEVERLITETNEAGKPLGFMCIAPAVAAKVLGHKNVQLTIGNNKDVAEKLESLGAKHVDKPVNEVVVDKENKVVTAPAYMYDEGPLHGIAAGIEKLVNEVLAMA